MSDELDRLITQWAARHAPELIAQAQADALELARERLRARLVDALLAAAEARLTERPPQPQPQPQEAAIRSCGSTASSPRAPSPRHARVWTATLSACTATET